MHYCRIYNDLIHQVGKQYGTSFLFLFFIYLASNLKSCKNAKNDRKKNRKIEKKNRIYRNKQQQQKTGTKCLDDY